MEKSNDLKQKDLQEADLSEVTGGVNLRDVLKEGITKMKQEAAEKAATMTNLLEETTPIVTKETIFQEAGSGLSQTGINLKSILKNVR